MGNYKMQEWIWAQGGGVWNKKMRRSGAGNMMETHGILDCMFNLNLK